MINRRNFIKKTAIASAGMALMPSLYSEASNSNTLISKKLLNAYYFRAHMYTIVPHQVREDMKWMADIGTDIVSIAILEQDLTAAIENVDIICNEADKLGMKVYAVPSRWGGMFAGAPKVPSLFSVRNPQTWILNKKGKPLTNAVSGVISSVHYPETEAFFKSSLDEIFKLWNIKGITWDEPKSFVMDYSPKAIEKLGENASLEAHINSVIDFYSTINKHIKDNNPDVETSLFAYANSSDLIVSAAAKTKYLDYYGCDGRPWKDEDGGKQESVGKVLLGTGERFLKAAHQNAKKSLWLIENHNMLDVDVQLMDKRMPEILQKNIDQLIYYYYPRNIETPDAAMNILAKHIKRFKK